MKKRILKVKFCTLCCLIMLFGTSCGHLYAEEGVGSPVSEIVLSDMDGIEFNLSELTGKPLLLLLADDSELSQEKYSQIAEIIDYYSYSELEIINIAVGKTPEEAYELQDDLWLPYTLYGDPQKTIARQFGLEELPQVIILDNHHIVKHIGSYTSNEALRQKLFKHMQEKVFVITGRQFEFEPNIITVNQGDRVLIKLLSEDVAHGIYVDGYELFVNRYLDREGEVVNAEEIDHHILPGEMGLLKFTADRTGRFSMRCAATCAMFHPYMYAWLKVKPNSRFYISAFLTILLVLLSLMVFSSDKNNKRILGFMPLSWRFNLTRFPIIRYMLSARWPRYLILMISTFFFVLILVSCFIGMDSAGNYNFGIMFVWIVWFVLLIMIMVPFFSRIFCGVCPLPFFGLWLQRGSPFAVKEKTFGLNKEFPNKLKNMWMVNILFMGVTFFNGFLTTMPIASFIMFAAIIVASTALTFIYKRRTFCRYVCPVGGFQGLYSNMATLEIRSKDIEVCKHHPIKACFIGSGEGFGCPWLEHPYAENRKNTYCGFCLECFKTCPKNNVALNIRPPGVDVLVDDHRGMDEAWKNFIMLGAAVVFYVFMMGPWGFLKDMQRAKTLLGLLEYIGISATFCLLVLPALYGTFVASSKWLNKIKGISYKKLFLNYSYSLTPLGLLIWVAFCFGFLLPSGSYVVAVISDPFAWGWDLFGTRDFGYHPFLTDWMPYLQIICLLFGVVFSIDIGLKISRQMFSEKIQAIKNFLPVAIFIGFWAITMLYLFLW